MRVYLCGLSLLLALAAWAGPVVRLDAGSISGTHADGVGAYLGIPFAAPPVGALRWRAPQPPAAWTATRACTAYGPSCPQGGSPFGRHDDDTRTSEDCLYLNVWAPEGAAQAPVMVWIHGGGFVNGSGAKPYYDGAALARAGVVVVTINYRLGAFGFFCHPALAAESSAHASGNYGLMDQLAALRWVGRNIAAFGGDSGNVTIFGESAGAVSVLTLMTLPAAQGLFHRAIAQSGSAPERLPGPVEAQRFWRTRAQKVGIPDWEGGLDALRKLDAKTLVSMSNGIGATPGASMRETLCRDGAVIADDPAVVFAAGKEARVPLIVGSNADEGTLFAQKGAPSTVKAYEALLRERFPAMADAILARYPAKRDADAADAYADALGDATFTASARRVARLHATNGHPTYRYFFTRTTRLATRLGLRAFHGAEIVYAFGNVQGVRFGADDRQLSAAMRAYWASFARTGTPQAPNAPAWPRYGADDRVLVLDTAITAIPDPRAAACDLWDRVRDAL
jgi:para-nitrobenzyl esterase